jgi:hypothetical protein
MAIRGHSSSGRQTRVRSPARPGGGPAPPARARGARGTAILIDNVAPRPTPPRWVYRLGAIRDLPADVRRHGWPQAWWLLKFRTSTAWLDHLTSDHYLSRQAFEQRYGAAFPGARFQTLGYAHALLWHNPA